MPTFKEMDPKLVWAALEGHKDVLTPEVDQISGSYESFKCPRCLCGLQKELDPRHVFADPSVMTPRSLLRCVNCRYLIDPHSNLIVEYGDASKTPVETIPIIDPQ
jgi:hypothetical protein